MDPQHLRTLLEQLHAELSQGPPLDESSRQLLLDVQNDIARTAGTTVPLPAGEHQQIRGRLREAVVGFEGSHPRLASTLEQMANALSNMGL